MDDFEFQHEIPPTAPIDLSHYRLRVGAPQESIPEEGGESDFRGSGVNLEDFTPRDRLRRLSRFSPSPRREYTWPDSTYWLIALFVLAALLFLTIASSPYYARFYGIG